MSPAVPPDARSCLEIISPLLGDYMKVVSRLTRSILLAKETQQPLTSRSSHGQQQIQGKNAMAIKHVTMPQYFSRTHAPPRGAFGGVLSVSCTTTICSCFARTCPNTTRFSMPAKVRKDFLRQTYDLDCRHASMIRAWLSRVSTIPALHGMPSTFGRAWTRVCPRRGGTSLALSHRCFVPALFSPSISGGVGGRSDSPAKTKVQLTTC